MISIISSLFFADFAMSVGIGQQLIHTSPVLTSGATCTSSNDVNDESTDQLVARTDPSTRTTHPNRKRPAVDSKVDRSASNPNGVVNLCDYDNAEEEEEEEEKTRSLINIDDNNEFPSLSPPSLPPSPSLTERPKRRTDIRRTPTKIDIRSAPSSIPSEVPSALHSFVPSSAPSAGPSSIPSFTPSGAPSLLFS